MMKTAVIFVTVFLVFFSNAQVQVEGRFRETVLMLQKAAHNSVYFAPKVDNRILQAQETFTDPHLTKPYKFAESIPFPIDILTNGHWMETNAIDGTPIRIWRAVIASDDALSISLQFEDFHLPDGIEFYIIGRESFNGAFVGEVNNKPDGSFATVPIAGDFLALELVVPASMKNQEDLRFKIGKIAHGFRQFPKSFQDSGSCNIDVACETDPKYDNVKKSVAMLVTQDGTRFCSGTMINNTKKDGRQLFLTANHCMFMSSANFVAIFNYQHSQCGGSATEPSVLQSAHGMDLLAKWAPSDFALLVIREKIPANYDVYLAGWDISRVAPSDVFGIHHPSGDVKKFTSFNGTCLLSSWTEVPNQFHWKVPAWTRGTTEPGSSGSALFNNQGLVVGHLHGGQASCANPDGYDVYGGLTFDYTTGILRSRRLKEHINPLNLNIKALGGMPLYPPQKDHSHTIPMEYLAEGEMEP